MKSTTLPSIALLLTLLLTVSSLFAQSPKQWKLIWNDEFDQAGAPDPQKWSFHGRNTAFWAKYAYDSDEMAYVKGGNLVLVARKAVNDTLPFQTAAISTHKSFAFRYGKLECRARFAPAQGSWPAIWLMPKGGVYGGWPKSGEIDVMEHLNFDTIAYQTVHTERTRAVAAGTAWTNSPTHATAPIVLSDFNVYGMEWNADGIDFYVNGRKTFTYPRQENGGTAQYPFDQDFYIILNQALGGNWAGEVEPQDLPVAMEVDWIRVYQ